MVLRLGCSFRSSSAGSVYGGSWTRCEPRVLQHLRGSWSSCQVFLQDHLHQGTEPWHILGHEMPRRNSCLCGDLDLLQAEAILQEQASALALSSQIWHLVHQDLHHNNAHGEDITSRKPQPCVPNFRWEVAWRSLNSAIAFCSHGSSQAEVNENHLWNGEVRCSQHYVGLLHIAVHHGILVQEGERLEALAKNATPIALIQGHSVCQSSALHGPEVTAMINFIHHIVELSVLEDFESVRQPLT
mmetsp:Transcript_4017/g.6778  ORF Transcript_4017/g.6778 Transcript_4017/m.6778 type:complete len:243 (+) Transcript_4017:101-829(+)